MHQKMADLPKDIRELIARQPLNNLSAGCKHAMGHAAGRSHGSAADDSADGELRQQRGNVVREHNAATFGQVDSYLPGEVAHHSV